MFEFWSLGHVHTRQVEHAHALPIGAEKRSTGTAVDAGVGKKMLAAVQPHRFELGQGGTDGAALFNFDTPESLWNEHRESTRGRDLDITGLSYAMLERDGPQQWPLREGDTTGAKRLYADGQFATPDGRARFAAVAARPLAEKRDAPYPFSLNTGRVRDHWHTMTRTGLAPELCRHVPEPYIEIHPADAENRGIKDGDWVGLRSRAGDDRKAVAKRAGRLLEQVEPSPDPSGDRGVPDGPRGQGRRSRA